MNTLARLGLSLILILMAGCAAPRQLTEFRAASTQTGQVRWQRGSMTLITNSIWARDAQNTVVLKLYKQAPEPLLDLRLEPDEYLTARGSLAGSGWQGPAGDLPRALSPWYALLVAYRQSASLPEGDREIHSAAWKTAVSKTGGQLRSISLGNRDNGETITVLFTR